MSRKILLKMKITLAADDIFFLTAVETLSGR
jgi:hypothetical protein